MYVRDMHYTQLSRVEARFAPASILSSVPLKMRLTALASDLVTILGRDTGVTFDDFLDSSSGLSSSPLPAVITRESGFSL